MPQASRALPSTLSLLTDTSFIEILWCSNPQLPLWGNNGVSGLQPFPAGRETDAITEQCVRSLTQSLAVLFV
ncbi:hypothetical protein AOLI_G00134620 [Acnodon oligacanthus]